MPAVVASSSMADPVDQVVRTMRADLRRYLASRLRDPADVDDVLQETFLRVAQRLHTLRDEDRLGPWVYRIARNAAADHQRRARREEALDDEPPDEGDDGVPNLNEEVAGWLRPMLYVLPEEYREALELTDLGGLTQEQLAERLGLSVSGAKTRVQRGRKRLREVLERCCLVEQDARGNVIGYEVRDQAAAQPSREDCCDGNARRRG